MKSTLRKKLITRKSIISISNNCMVYIWVLSLGMISPNDQVIDVFDWYTSFQGNLPKRSVHIESSKSSKVFSRDRRSILHGNHAIR